MIGPNQPPAGGGGRGRGRRGRRNDGQGKRRQKQSGSQHNRHGGIYTAPMDHSYRNALHGNGSQRGRSQRSGELEPGTCNRSRSPCP